MELTQEYLKSILHYDLDSGVFVWISGARKGKRAGFLRKYSDIKKYRYIAIGGIDHPEHRLAFLYVCGAMPHEQVDHIDGNGENNSWNNLRDVSSLENSRNRKLHSSNSSGVHGVYRERKTGDWKAVISLNGDKVYLGRRKDFFEACCLRKSAERKLGFHINHGRDR